MRSHGLRYVPEPFGDRLSVRDQRQDAPRQGMGGEMWTEPEIVKVVLQIVTILVAGFGIGIAIYQLRLVYITYRDLHDWNRRKAALDAVEKVFNELAKDTPLLEEKFQIMVKTDGIPLKQVRQEC